MLLINTDESKMNLQEIGERRPLTDGRLQRVQNADISFLGSGRLEGL